MKNLLKNSCVVFSVCSTFLLISTIGFSALNEQVNRVVAKVGSEIITSVELDRIVNPIIKEHQKRYSGEELSQKIGHAKLITLNSMIERKLLNIEADRMEIALPEVEVDKYMNKVKANYGSEENFNAFLIKEGVTLEEMREMAADELKSQIIIHEKIIKKINVLPSEIHDYYQLHVSEFLRPAQVRMYQILIKKTDNPIKDLKVANDILKQLKDGANFQQLAQLKSQGPKKKNGGLWGYITLGFFGDEMYKVENAAFKLKPAQFSEIIETDLGFHIVYIDRKRISKILTEREAYDDIYNRLSDTQFSKIYKKYLDYLRGKTYIEIIAD